MHQVMDFTKSGQKGNCQLALGLTLAMFRSGIKNRESRTGSTTGPTRSGLVLKKFRLQFPFSLS